MNVHRAIAIASAAPAVSATLCEDCPPVCYPTDRTRCTPCPRRVERAILARLNTGENYGEGTPLEAAIFAHCRATGRDIEWVDAAGNVTCFGDVGGRA